MTFDQALIAMREGKRVRRTCWRKGKEIFIRDNIIWTAHPELTNGPEPCPYVHIESIFATDWELCDE